MSGVWQFQDANVWGKVGLRAQDFKETSSIIYCPALFEFQQTAATCW